MADASEQAPNVWTKVEVGGVTYLCLPISTRWLRETDDLIQTATELTEQRRIGDTVIVSEKVALLLTGNTTPMSEVVPGRLALFLATKVRPRMGSRGLSIPEKMQYLVNTVGASRLFFATAAATLTRPFGVHGMFYRVAGPLARDIDGGRPPYEDRLFPPFEPAVAHDLCEFLEEALGVGAAIVDINDFGGSIRGVSSRSLDAPTLLAVLRDNPLGQRGTSTPLGIVRPL